LVHNCWGYVEPNYKLQAAYERSLERDVKGGGFGLCEGEMTALVWRRYEENRCSNYMEFRPRLPLCHIHRKTELNMKQMHCSLSFKKQCYLDESSKSEVCLPAKYRLSAARNGKNYMSRSEDVLHRILMVQRKNFTNEKPYKKLLSISRIR
jgi:hypothetical protein